MTGPEKQKGTNAFGGKNPHGLYVPITETEREVLSRLVEADDLEVVIHGWGVLQQPRITFGDLRIRIAFQVNFNAPTVPQPVYFFDLELRTRAGLSLFRERQPTVYNGQPLQAAAGVYVDMVWDIALSHIDPKVVKQIKPGAIGLTSRRLDKDTGEKTLRGNLRPDSGQQRLLHHLRVSEEAIKKRDLEKLVKAHAKAGNKMRVVDKGVEVDQVR